MHKAIDVSPTVVVVVRRSCHVPTGQVVIRKRNSFLLEYLDNHAPSGIIIFLDSVAEYLCANLRL
jgi:hypothetical protein